MGNQTGRNKPSRARQSLQGKNWIQLDLGEPKAVYSVDLIVRSDKQWALKGAKVTFLNDQYEVLKLHELDDDGNRVEEYDDSGDPTWYRQNRRRDKYTVCRIYLW
jgi:hypothetical protein